MSEADMEFWRLVWLLFAIIGIPVGLMACIVFAASQILLMRMMRDRSRHFPPPPPFPPETTRDKH
jgi:hypothetical protein